ncbi:MAG TPA: prolyl-tRNA synthetase associated domain-containing protein [Rhizomicrobium sp.]|nr:prolyl-tRNA synthetase associated domain-containing protein [Rhizomicrobium sp.]
MSELPAPELREEALYERLRALGIAWHTYEHAPVFTVDEAAQLYDTQPGAHTKNLFLKDKKDQLWLVVCRDALKVDLNALSRQLGSPRFSFGPEALLLSTLGVPPGSVTPFSILNDTEGKVRVVLDEGMLALEPLNYHPLRNDRTTAIRADDLLKFLRACDHEPVIASIPERA